MAFAYPGDGSLDYFPCQYGNSKVLFRGPRRNIDAPFCAVLGGTETYGKFIPQPYPTLVEERTGRQVVNFGCPNAGPDVYLNDPDLMALVSRADLTILQIFGATNLSNRFYTVHPRRNDRFLRASSWLRSVYREVDFTDFHFTRHMLHELQDVSEERFKMITAELQDTWVSRMKDILARSSGKTLLLWMGSSPPPKIGRLARSGIASLVDAAMVADVASHALAYLEVIVSENNDPTGMESMAFSPLERPAAAQVPGPLAHREVAAAVAKVMEGLL